MSQRRAPATTPARRPLAPELTSTSTTQELVRYLHRCVKLTDRELETIIGAHPNTIRRWRSEKDQSEPRKRGRLDDVRAIVGMMVNSGAFDAEEAGRFLRSRSDDLDYQPPLALLADKEGADQRNAEFDRVREVAEALVQRVLGTNAASSDKPVSTRR